MTGVARPCPLDLPSRMGFDSLSPITGQIARMAKAAGYGWIGRYITDDKFTLSLAERDAIFEAGLGIAPLTEAVTSVRLFDTLGAELGGKRARQLVGLGCPLGVDLWTDHESPSADGDSVGYLNARAQATISTGYGPGLYVGSPEDLGDAALFALRFDRYWKGAGRVSEPTCGWSVLQLEPLESLELAGLKFDVDVVKQDYQGRTPVLWWPA